MCLTRACTKCGEEKPLTAEFFYEQSRDSGFRYDCRECVKQYVKRRYKAKQAGTWVSTATPHDPATQSPDLKDIYWAAGFFDGEGHVDHHGGTFRCKVTQTKDTWALDRLKQFFGGRVSHGREPGNGWSTRYDWNVNGARAIGFALTIYPLLQPRRQQAIKAALDGHLKGRLRIPAVASV